LCDGSDPLSTPQGREDAAWARQDSNLHATGYEPAALTVELRARTHPTSVADEHEVDLEVRAPDAKRLRCAAVKVALASAAAVALLCTAARADVVDLSEGQRRRSVSGSGFSLRADFGNAFAPYGYAGGAIGYMSEGLFGFEAGAGAGFPGVQLGFALRKLFGEGNSYLATELSIAGNTKVARGASSGVPTPNSASQNIWGSIGMGFEQRIGHWAVNTTVDLAFTPSDSQAHFGVHGGIGFYF
jgi:opacity protein-like surface antigen